MLKEHRLLLCQIKKPFDITLSVEKENSAWRTLRLRAFTRQFKGGLPSEYYGYIAGKLGNSPEDELFKIYPAQADQANKEALQFTLGDDCNLDLDALVRERLKKSNNWVLIGGPPCQAYSLVGRARNKGNSEMTKSRQVIEFILWLKHGNLIQGQILMILLSVQNNTVFLRKDTGSLSLVSDMTLKGSRNF
ncbi:hypothetical protein [Methylobacter sp.]|uniref:hypothetical protein n=1 Tax=Methylobacter sp. TaxID=2051955 RepID=UPI0024881810|nr:hypothetical protein [Methylobacter sp.]MDI1359689.1 hypothetical protein [Methylobacter sp.]